MAAPSTRSAGGIDLPPARAEGPWDRIRRRWHSRNRYPAFKFWLLFYGLPIVAAFGALFVLNGFLNGWRRSYDVVIAITSPADTPVPGVAWLLSVGGWLVAPVIAGAVAGYVVTASIGARRRMPIQRAFAKDDDG